jgi:hypothetical protein
MKAQKKR